MKLLAIILHGLILLQLLIPYVRKHTNFKKEIIQQFSMSYRKLLNVSYKSILFEGKGIYNISPKSVYPRGNVNREPRTKQNDVHYYLSGIVNALHPREMDFEQQYDLEFYQGSNYVGTSGFPVEMNNQTEFTIISQTSSERLFFLPMLIDRWQGPFCIVIFLTKREVRNVKNFILQQHFPERLHLILYITKSKRGDCIYRNLNGFRCIPEKIYPLNRLRNIAIQNVQTTHFIIFDMDMWPSKHLYATLHDLPSNYLESPYVATIIPAFSFTQRLVKPSRCHSLESCVKYASTLYPETKEELIHCINTGGCSIFRPSTRTHDYLPNGWSTMNNNTILTKMKCFRRYYMEPYVMVRKTPHTPLFAEKFTNYGFNKVQWIENLRYVGYEFHVLSHAYAVDMPHPRSKFAENFARGFKEMKNLYLNFLKDLRSNHEDESRQIICYGQVI